MDAILDICFSENLFKMPKRKSKDGTSKLDIPSNNPYKYCSTVEPILETHCVTKEGLIGLPYRATHKVSSRSVKIKENDALYDICDAAWVWGRPKATRHTKECLLPRRPDC